MLEKNNLIPKPSFEDFLHVRERMEKEKESTGTATQPHSPQSLIASQIAGFSNIVNIDEYRNYLQSTGKLQEIEQDIESINALYDLLMSKHTQNPGKITEEEIEPIIQLMEGIEENLK